MTAYKILHIPSGRYYYDIYYTKNSCFTAKDSFFNLLKYHRGIHFSKETNTFSVCLSTYYECSIIDPSPSEFEIIEIEEG